MVEVKEWRQRRMNEGLRDEVPCPRSVPAAHIHINNAQVGHKP